VLFGSIIVRYDFASPAQVFLNLLVDNAYLIVLAVGMTFVILTGGIDLSVGSVVARSTVILAKTLQAGLPTPVAIVLVLTVGPLLGLLMGSVIEFFDVQPFIVTLAGMFLARGLCYVISVDTLPIKDPALRALGLNYVYVYEDKFIRWTVVIALIVVVIAAYVLHQTRFGRTVYALGGSRQSAQLMGLSTTRTQISVYVVSGFCAALTGLLIGVLVLGSVQVLVTTENLDSYWTRIMTGVLLLVFVLVQRVVLRKSP
jgi:simple sugar transport system permease protein